jgi:predicted ArsR family transcriptional regulator
MKTTKTKFARNKSIGRTYNTVKQSRGPLERLTTLLQGERFWTARELARRQRISRVQMYRRLEQLRASGVVFAQTFVRERETGPLSKAFRVI